MAFIYKIINDINNKVYIGKTNNKKLYSLNRQVN